MTQAGENERKKDLAAFLGKQISSVIYKLRSSLSTTGNGRDKDQISLYLEGCRLPLIFLSDLKIA